MVTFFLLLVGRHAFFSALHIWGEGGRRFPTLAINIALWGDARKSGSTQRGTDFVPKNYKGTFFSHEPDPKTRSVSSIYNRIWKKHHGNLCWSAEALRRRRADALRR